MQNVKDFEFSLKGPCPYIFNFHVIGCPAYAPAFLRFPVNASGKGITLKGILIFLFIVVAALCVIANECTDFETTFGASVGTRM